MKISVPLSEKFKQELVDAADEQEEKKQAQKEQKMENRASAMIEVAHYGVEKWKRLLEWGIANHVFTPQDISFLKVAIAMETGKFPSERQCARILQVLKKAREESYPE